MDEMLMGQDRDVDKIFKIICTYVLVFHLCHNK